MNEARRKRGAPLDTLATPAARATPAALAAPRPLRSAAAASRLPTAAALQFALASVTLGAPFAVEACARPPSDEIHAESPSARTFASASVSASATPAPVASASASIAPSASASVEPSTRPMTTPGRMPAVSPRPVPSSSGRVIVKPPPAAPAATIPPVDKGPKVLGGEMGVQATPRARSDAWT